MSNSTPSFNQLPIVTASQMVTVGADQIIAVSNIKQARRVRNAIIIDHNDGTPPTRFVYATDAVAAAEYVALAAQLASTAPVGPAIYAIAPSSLDEAASATLVLAGVGMAAGFTVTIGGVDVTAACTLISASEIDIAWVGGTLTAGAYNVVYTHADATTSTLVGGFVITTATGVSPKLLAIIPNYVPANAPVPSWGVDLVAIGLNFPANAIVDIESSGIGMLSIMLGDSMLWNHYQGSSFVAGTYDVVLWTDAGKTVELDRITNGFQVYAAISGNLPNNDIWVTLGGGAIPAPTTETPTDVTLSCFFHGSSDDANYDTLYAWNPNTASWVGIITV